MRVDSILNSSFHFRQSQQSLGGLNFNVNAYYLYFQRKKVFYPENYIQEA
jgi:hypothetical protein